MQVAANLGGDVKGPLALGSVTVFCPMLRRFVPFFHRHSPAFICVAASPRDSHDFERLASLYQLASGPTHVPTVSADQNPLIQAMATRLTQIFGLPVPTARQIDPMLRAVLPVAWYRMRRA